jgi:hypothetical protein
MSDIYSRFHRFGESLARWRQRRVRRETALDEVDAGWQLVADIARKKSGALWVAALPSQQAR